MDQSIQNNQIFECGPIQDRIANIELPSNRMAECIQGDSEINLYKKAWTTGKGEARVLLQCFAKSD
jgi:hypothetical protein